MKFLLNRNKSTDILWIETPKIKLINSPTN